MLEAALVAWLVSLLGDRALKAVKRTVLGRPEREALTAAMGVAIESVLARAPEQSQAVLRDALRGRFAEVPVAVLDGRTRVRTALIRAIQAQIAPLADPAITPSGRSFFEEIGVDAARLREDIADVVIRSIEQVGPGFPALSPLIGQLNADAIIARVDLVLDAIGPPQRAQLPGSGDVHPPGRRRRQLRTDDNGQHIDAVEFLIDALLSVPTIIDDSSRQAVFNMLPAQLRDAIPRNPMPRVQILTAVRTCQNYTGGLRTLIRAIRLIERDSLAMRELDNLILELDAGNDPPDEEDADA